MNGHNILNLGLGDVTVKRNKVEITYNGNMGARMSDIAAMFDERFGHGTFERVRERATSEKGNPDYSYKLVITRARFRAIVGEVI